MASEVSLQVQSINQETVHLLNTDRDTTRKRKLCFKCVRWTGAAICLALMIGSWITMAEKLQAVGESYHKPFFQTYWIHSFYTIMYVIWKLWIIFPGKLSCNKVGEGSLTNFKTLAVASGVLALLSFVSGVLWYLSLPRTSVSANTSIYQSASAIVFIISVPLLGERVTLLKIVSVCLTIAGVCVVSIFGLSSKHHQIEPPSNSSNSSAFLESSGEEHSTPLGYVYVVGSMILYAFFETGYKKFATKQDDPAPVQNGARVLGYIGIHTLLWTWPILPIFHFTGVERFELPNLNIFKQLVLNTFLDVIYNGTLLICIALSSPLFATVGVVLTVPASVVVDWLVRRYLLPWQAFLGIAIILIGFFSLIFSEYWGSRYHDNHDQTEDMNSLGSHVQDTSLSGKWKNMCCKKTKTRHEKRSIWYYII